MARAARVTIHKSASTGRIVSAKYAAAHKATTYKTTVTRKSGK